MTVPVFSLSIHADYGCRHSGACCSTDWDVPVELRAFGHLNAALASRRLPVPLPFIAASLRSNVDSEEAAAPWEAVLRREEGTCVLFDRETHHCIVHRDLGEDALPATCRLFPRIALRDPRGTFITLSHYCPTAASMLFREDVPLEVVEGPHAFPDGDYEGLTATDQWPPLLRPTVLMDLPAYSAWERHLVGICAAASATPEAVVATLRRDAGMLDGWRPGLRSEPLRDAIAGLPAGLADVDGRDDPSADLPAALDLYWMVAPRAPAHLYTAALPPDLGHAYRELVAPAWRSWTRVLNRYLAAHGFASWCAYQGRGLRSLVRSIELALAVVSVEAARACSEARRELDRDLLLAAVRQSDFLLRHGVPQEVLVRVWRSA